MQVAATGRIRDCHADCLRVLWAIDRLDREFRACVLAMADTAAVEVRRKAAAAVQSTIYSATNGALARTRRKH